MNDDERDENDDVHESNDDAPISPSYSSDAQMIERARRRYGSIGAVVTMQKYFKVPIIFLGLSLPEHGYHAPNENYDWEQASGGMKMFEKYFSTLALG